MNDDQLYSEFLAGKKVVLVGPAPTMIGSKQGTVIDQYDVVVRIKKVLSQFEHLKEDIGCRTDVLYSWLDREPSSNGKIDFDAITRDSVKFVCCPYPEGVWFSDPDIKAFLNMNHGRFKFHAIDKDYYLNVENKIKTRPNSGIGAILDLLRHDVSELYITGFTFFKGGYIKEYELLNEQQAMKKMNYVGVHSQPPQIELMKEIVKEDARVRVDAILAEIISS